MGVTDPTARKLAKGVDKASLATMREYSVDPRSICPLKIPSTVIN